MQFKGLISRFYMFFGTWNPNAMSTLQSEVELMVFLHMRSDKITKTAKNALKMPFEDLVSRIYMFFGTRIPNLRFILKPEVEFMVFLRMRSNKITKTLKNVLKIQFEGLISRAYMFFGTGNRNLRSFLKPEVENIVFLRMRGNNITKNGRKCP